MRRFFLMLAGVTICSSIGYSQVNESGRAQTSMPNRVEVLKTTSVVNRVASNQDIPDESASVDADTLYVKGSLGVGVDITDGQDFGLNTVILKENNLRILFDDSSTPSGGFPANDWLIEANSSESGGENYFSVQDVSGNQYPFKIMAGASTNSFHLNGDGNIGLGTENASVKLHLLNGDTPAIRLQQDNSMGWGPSTWDVAGNETNFFIRDVENDNRLPFRIQPGTPTNSLTLRATGNVGLGTWSPEETLDVKGNIKLDSLLRFSPRTMEAFEANEGDLYMDATDHLLKLFNGTEWVSWKSSQSLSLTDSSLSISGVDAKVDLTAFMDNTDEQILSLEGSVLSISNGNEIDLSGLLVEQQNQIDELKQTIVALQEIISAMSTGVKDLSSGLKSSSLDQNIPNPFSTSTQIPFNINSGIQEAFILIYSQQGQLVEKIKINQRGAGSYNYVVNDATANLFFYALYADGVKGTTKKMVVTH